LKVKARRWGDDLFEFMNLRGTQKFRRTADQFLALALRNFYARVGPSAYDQVNQLFK